MPDAAPTLPDPTPTQLLNALSECAVDLADLRDPQLVLQGMVRRTRSLLGTDMAYLSRNDLARGETHIEVTDGVQTEAYRRIRMPLGTGVLGSVAAGGTDVQTRDYLHDPAMNHLPYIDEIVRGEGVCAIHGCPVRAGGRVVAALLVAHRTPIRFTRRQVAALRRMAEHTAIALEPAHAGSENGLLLFADELVERVPDGPQAVCDLLAERLDQPVELHGTEPTVAGTVAGVLRTAITTTLHSGSPVAVPAGATTTTVLAIRHHDEHVATVIVPIDPLLLGEWGRLLMSRSAAAVGAALVARQRLTEAELRHGSDVVDALLRTERPRAELLSRLAALGFRRRQPVTVLVVAAGRTSTAVGMLATRLAAGAPVLSAAHGEESVVITPVPDAGDFAERLHGLLGDGGVLLGWTVVRRQEEASQAYVTARRVILAARALGITRMYADPARLGLAGILVAGADPAVVDAIIGTRIQPLLDRDAAGDHRLTETAWVVLECGGRLREAAARLHVHPNTVRQRSERISTLLGREWRVAPESLDVHFALRLWRVREALVAAAPEITARFSAG